ncbi:hypothetical protein GC173_11465 [bacterium]|nr:hypothetical protein [bacterium]
MYAIQTFHDHQAANEWIRTAVEVSVQVSEKILKDPVPGGNLVTSLVLWTVVAKFEGDVPPVPKQRPV